MPKQRKRASSKTKGASSQRKGTTISKGKTCQRGGMKSLSAILAAARRAARGVAKITGKRTIGSIVDEGGATIWKTWNGHAPSAIGNITFDRDLAK